VLSGNWHHRVVLWKKLVEIKLFVDIIPAFALKILDKIKSFPLE
jgi:hypothetical protein